MEKEKYIELYKKYRPRKWLGLIGQQTQARSIQRAIVANKVPTAYLFSGPRGCGKTSAALLTAKAINCLNPNLETGDPCNKCEVCVSIDNGTAQGVTYISAASMKGVDEVRKLVQNAKMQSQLNRQVFIIDEIHNLKTGGGKGFEALLIPLEEEDMPSLFIFCTTEIEKVPDTILSRVQSRKFNLVSEKEMKNYISRIAKNENLREEEGLNDEQLDAILDSAVRLGRGSVRDTITKLEEEISKIGDSEFEEGSNFGGDLLEAISEQNVPRAWSVIAEAEAVGVDARALGEQLFEDIRSLVLIDSDPETDLTVAPPVGDIQKVIEGFQRSGGLLRVSHEIGDGLSRMTWGGDARINLEISVARAVKTLKALASRKKNG